MLWKSYGISFPGICTNPERRTCLHGDENEDDDDGGGGDGDGGEEESNRMWEYTKRFGFGYYIV